MPLTPPVLDDRLGGLGAGPVEAVEGSRRQGPVEHRPVGGQLGLQVVENALRQAAGIGAGLHHQRRHRTDQHRFRHTDLTVPGDVVHDFAATSGVPDMDGVPEIEMGRQRRQVVGVVVHVVTVAGLRGAAVPAPVMGDDAVAVLQEEQHLGVPVVARKRSAVTEDDRLARAPVLVEDLRVIGRRDRAHALPPLVWALPPKRPHGQANQLSVSTPGHPADAAVNPRDRHPIRNVTGRAAHTVATE